MQIHQSVDELKLPPIHINRNYMIFGSTLNKDLYDKSSLTYKNSSENFSVSQSMPEENSEKINRGDMLKRVSTNSSYVNKISSAN